MSHDESGEAGLLDLSSYCLRERPLDVWGTAFELIGQKAGGIFLARYRLGYNRQSGFWQDEVELEPDTFHLEHVEAHHRPGLGSAATALVLSGARRLGYSTARMKLTHPRMVGVIEKLRRLDVIQSRYYMPGRADEIRPEAATAEFATASSLMEPEKVSITLEASALANARSDDFSSKRGRLPSSKTSFIADCVITF